LYICVHKVDINGRGHSDKEHGRLDKGHGCTNEGRGCLDKMDIWTLEKLLEYGIIIIWYKKNGIIEVEDTCNNGPLLGHVQFEIRQTYSSKKRKNLHSFFKINKGMKVMLTENQYATFG
jgi:hypothetical protein